MRKEETMPDFVKVEHDILKFWKDSNAFEKLVKKNEGAPVYRALDGPITANNRMGIHHVWGRTLKDIYIKYKAMSGFAPKFQNGFDCHGLPVEVEVEKALGIKNKKEILEYGMDKFIEACGERVEKYSAIQTEQSIRQGQWMDWDNSYYTNSDTNITSIWHFLKEINNRGYLVKSGKPMHWCPRCATSLSAHEMHGSYKEVEHTAVFLTTPIKNSNLSMVVWTTTPWTLTSNVAIAVNPENTYLEVKVKSQNRHLVVGKEALNVLKDDVLSVEREFLGAELVGLEYEAFFPDLEIQNFSHKVVEWQDVSATDGSGLVHIAPGCGEEDFQLGKKLGLQEINPIDENGVILPEFGVFAGYNTQQVAEVVFEELKKQNKLYYTHKFTHNYPVCWRCKSEIVFRSVESWFIKVDELRPQLLEAVKTVKWEPDYMQKRMEDWLNNMGDWNISRSRYYGVPLPIFITEKGEVIVVGSKEELRELAVEPKLVDGLPHLHRPFIDEIKIKSPITGDVATRIPEVGDTWLDAGITPFSTNEYFTNKEEWEKNFPAEVVIEMREQVRLWFYSLLMMSVVLTGKAPYEKVIGHEAVIQENGDRFSKSGYAIDATEFADKVGADTGRYLYAQTSYSNAVRFSYRLAEEARRKMLGFWNSYTFYNTYAVIDKPDLQNYAPNEKNFTVTDKWLIEVTNQFIKNSKENYDNHKSDAVVKDFEKLIDDISNFYIRTNRRRFWKNETADDKLTAYWVLYNSLKAITAVMAPIIPFMAEKIWQGLVRQTEKNAPESVLLHDFPTSIYNKSYKEYIVYVEHIQNIITISQRLRNENQLKVKQPLSKVYVVSGNDVVFRATEVFKELLQEELNVRDVVNTQDSQQFNDFYLMIDFKRAGAVLKGDAQKLKKYLDNLPHNDMQKLVEDYNNNSVNIEGFGSLDSELFSLHLKPKQDYVLITESDLTVVLDTVLTPELVREGMLREIIRSVQVLRKEADFNIEARVLANITSTHDEITSVVNEFSENIKSEILAKEFNESEFLPDIEKVVEVSDKEVLISLKSL